LATRSTSTPNPVSPNASRNSSTHVLTRPLLLVGEAAGCACGYPVGIRAVTSEDAMTGGWTKLPHDVIESVSSQIVNEIPAVSRVRDVTSKPPATIEWE